MDIVRIFNLGDEICKRLDDVFYCINNYFLIKIIIICFINLAVLVTKREMDGLHILSFIFSKDSFGCSL